MTSAEPGILVMHTIMSGGGGLDALKNAMIIGALPLVIVMVLMCTALAKAILRAALREKHADLVARPAESLGCTIGKGRV